MGVPKFFRFIADRYPAINKTIKDYEIPEYDNLYLDMTSIIHACSHPENSDIYFRVGKKKFSDEEIFQNICRYIDIIYRIVKPLKLMFIAFDGVAPRAKMNQQRATRFRVAEDLTSSSLKKDLLNEDNLFDGNCITPGTKFMADLIENMKHFVALKISTDPLWQKCKIFISGPEVPGEGEHKIMQFIRHKKTKQDYNPNTRHCLYSLDADLIMLGLCIHEPHFSLIHEKVTLGKISNMLTPEESDFHLLHLSLLREYLENEFVEVKEKLKFEFDLEKIIDDWILIGFLVGNDFIPNLPDIHIIVGALPTLYQVYMKILPSLDGYINNAGELKLHRFEKYIKCLCDEILRNNESLQHYETELDSNSQESLKFKKENYYREKLKFDNINDSIIRTVVEDYIRAIQWNLEYYYNGCTSWSWYYPYHYAPYIFDIKEIENIDLKFELSKPFLPLQHLLAVLPPASSHLLPESMRFLLTNSKSPIIDFYPEAFETDMNGKINDWEAVVLIPFIDEKRLLEAIEPYNSQLSLKERKRNTSGATCNFSYTATSLGQYPAETIFDSFINHAQLELIKQEEILMPKEKLIKGLCHGVRFDLSFPGFPTLKHIPYSFEFQLLQSNFNRISNAKVNKMVFNIHPRSTVDLKVIAKELLGQTIYVNWPHLEEAYVIGVTDFENSIFLQNYWKKYDPDNLRHEKVIGNASLHLQKEKKSISDKYREEFSINIGEVKVFVYIFSIMGKRYNCGTNGKVQLQTRWNSTRKLFPYQLVVKDLKLFNITTNLYKTAFDMFTPSSHCAMIGHPNYGSIAEVKSVAVNKQRVLIDLKVEKEPDLTEAEGSFSVTKTDYLSCNSAAKKLNVSPILVSRITGSLMVIHQQPGINETVSYDIGLRIKRPRQNKELFGYTKKKDDANWYYSNTAVELIYSYLEKFPDLFFNIHKNPNAAQFSVLDLFPEGLSALEEVKSWLSEQETSYTTFLECGIKSLDVENITKVEKIVSDFFSKGQECKSLVQNVAIQNLYKPGTTIGLVPPDIKAEHRLLDRIISMRNDFTVPLGSKGTIIGIQEKEDKWRNIYEILFDSAFTGGLTLYSSSPHRCYRLRVADFINISYGQRDAKNKEENADTSSKVKKDEQTESSTTKSRTNYSPEMNKLLEDLGGLLGTINTKKTELGQDNQDPQTESKPLQNETSNIDVNTFVEEINKIIHGFGISTNKPHANRNKQVSNAKGNQNDLKNSFTKTYGSNSEPRNRQNKVPRESSNTTNQTHSNASKNPKSYVGNKNQNITSSNRSGDPQSQYKKKKYPSSDNKNMPRDKSSNNNSYKKKPFRNDKNMAGPSRPNKPVNKTTKEDISVQKSKEEKKE